MNGLATLSPFGTMLDNPIGESAFEADIVTDLLGFDPFVLQNLLALGLKFPIQGGIPNQIRRGAWIVRRHKSQCYFLITHELTIPVEPDNLKVGKGK